MKNNQCWASGFDACSEKMSREHLISKGIFNGSVASVQGFDWCIDKPVRVGIGSLTAKILCSKHNSLLEAADRAGIQAVRVFESSVLNWQAENSSIDGFLFERWLLKTAINTSFGADDFIGVGMTDGQPGIPSAYLLQVVFGKMQFTHKMGAYFYFPDGEYKTLFGEILISRMRKNQEIGGFLFCFSGIYVFLSLFPGHAPPSFLELGVNTFSEIIHSKPIYRVGSIITTANNSEKRLIKINWSSTAT